MGEIGNIDNIYEYQTQKKRTTVRTELSKPPFRFLEFGTRAHLRAVYHFDCACSVCALPKEESAASDRRLGQMADTYSMFSM